MKQRRHRILLFVSLVVLIGFIVGYYIYQSKKVIHIALVGPITGQSPENGRHQYQGIKLYFDEINDQGGVNGYELVLDVYNDRNDPQLAEEKALEVVNNNRAVAVIGHNYSSSSIKAGEIYKAHRIPAVSATSTDINVTLGNDWYFRVVHNNNLQGRLLADYVKTVLKEDQVSIIHEDLAYGTYLAEIFEKNLKKLGVDVQNKWEIKTGNQSSVRKMETIAKQLKNLNKGGVIFLAVHAPEGIQLVKQMRDVGIQNMLIGPNALASKEFAEGFAQFPKEKLSPGFYSNGIHVISPLVFDSAGEKIQHFREKYRNRYEEEPDWRAVFAYETAVVLASAIKTTKITGATTSIQSDRRTLRDFLANLTKTNSIEGITGHNYFDENGDSPGPISIGVYKNKKIISAFTQIQSVHYLEEIPDFQKALSEEQIVSMDSGYMYKTNVVYTGVQFNEISNIDLKKRSATLDFNIWFRYQGKVEANDIEFLNGVEPIELGDPVEMKSINKISYEMYRVKGNFKVDFSRGVYTFDKHLVGISFRNKTQTQKNLLYVVDVLGMGMTDAGSLPGYLKDNRILTQRHKYLIDQVRYSQDTIRNTSMGNPLFLNALKETVEYSGMNAGVLIKKKSITLRGVIPPKYINTLILISMIMVFLLIYSKSRIGKKWPNVAWLFQLLLMSLLLLAGEVALVSLLSEKSDIYYLNLLVVVFDILWWFISAYLVNSAIQQFVMDSLEKKTKRKIPNLARRFVAFSIYFFAVSGIIAFVYDQKITSLLATSGLVAMIIGLAIQINISNIFSGIAINLETPFRINDWVKIGSFDEGKVVDITWRSTRIKTRDGSILSIPNSMTSESVILNFNYPDDNCSMYFMVHIDPVYRYERVQKILLDAVISAEGVLDDPAPSVTFSRFTDWSAEYAVSFYINEYEKRVTFTRNVWKRIYIHLNRVGITPLVKRQEIRMSASTATDTIDDSLYDPTINNMKIFENLSDKAKSSLNRRIKMKRFNAGDIISSQTEGKEEFFLIAEGVIEQTRQTQEQKALDSRRLGVENIFRPGNGQNTDIEYKSITDTVLFGLAKSDVDLLDESSQRVFENKWESE